MNTTRLICHHCEAEKLGLMELGEAHLCLDCYDKHIQVQNSKAQTQSNTLESLINLMAWADAMVEYQLGFSPRPPTINTSRGKIMSQKIELNNSNIGLVNNGEIHAESIQTPIQSGTSNEHINLQKLLSEFIRAIKECDEISSDDKNAYIEKINFLTNEINTAPEQRRNFMTSEIINSLEGLAKVAANLQTLWNIGHPLILSILGK